MSEFDSDTWHALAIIDAHEGRHIVSPVFE